MSNIREVLEDLLVARELLQDLAPKRAPLRRELGVDLLDVRQEEAAEAQVVVLGEHGGGRVTFGRHGRRASLRLRHRPGIPGVPPEILGRVGVDSCLPGR